MKKCLSKFRLQNQIHPNVPRTPAARRNRNEDGKVVSTNRDSVDPTRFPGFVSFWSFFFYLSMELGPIWFSSLMSACHTHMWTWLNLIYSLTKFFFFHQTCTRNNGNIFTPRRVKKVHDVKLFKTSVKWCLNLLVSFCIYFVYYSSNF